MTNEQSMDIIRSHEMDGQGEVRRRFAEYQRAYPNVRLKFDEWQGLMDLTYDLWRDSVSNHAMWRERLACGCAEVKTGTAACGKCMKSDSRYPQPA